MKKNISLKDKFIGCIAGVHVGSAMGAAVECLTYQEIEEKYGMLDRFVPYMHYHDLEDPNAWMREAGTTEDGVERQKLMIKTIIEKEDRITAEDLRKAWIDHMNPDAPGNLSEMFESKLLQMAKTPMPATDIGKYCDYSGLVTLARACHPIGLINAGDIQHALEDIYEVGKVYNAGNTKAIQWAGIVVTAIAEATKPNATVDSTLDSILRNRSTMINNFLGYNEMNVVNEIEKGLELTANCKDFRDLREVFEDVYSGIGVPYPFSYANEVVTKGICIFKMVKGNLKDAIITSVNMGRDTDCVAAIAAGISGALTGWREIPEEWIQQVDYATSINPYTFSKKTVKEHGTELYNAYKSKLKKLRLYIDKMDNY